MNPIKEWRVANRAADGKKARCKPDSDRLSRLSLVALGLVFGDIATSSLYAIRECFFGEYGIEVSRANVLGTLSFVFWTLVMIVALKYLTFVVKADNHGEGGVIAFLSSLPG